ncbi:MAG: hypothetical protein MI745_14000, partial [Pseudomonadales bacterium]|nr:hypothetical protein [Pseudomonadales bacterium]
MSARKFSRGTPIRVEGETPLGKSSFFVHDLVRHILDIVDREISSIEFPEQDRDKYTQQEVDDFLLLKANADDLKAFARADAVNSVVELLQSRIDMVETSQSNGIGEIKQANELLSEALRQAIEQVQEEIAGEAIRVEALIPDISEYINREDVEFLVNKAKREIHEELERKLADVSGGGVSTAIRRNPRIDITGIVDKQTIAWDESQQKFVAANDIYVPGSVGAGDFFDSEIVVDGFTYEVHFAAHTNSTGENFCYLANRHADSANLPAAITLAKSRGTHSSPTAVLNGDTLASLSALGYDGTDYTFGALIEFVVNGTVAADSVPTDIRFRVEPDGGGVAREIARITDDGLTLANPAATFSYTIATAAITADRTLNLPAITTDDTLAAIDFGTLGTPQEWTGTNYISEGAFIFDSSTLRLGNPNLESVVTVNRSGSQTGDATVTLPNISASDTFAMLGTSQTFSNTNTFTAQARFDNNAATPQAIFDGSGAATISNVSFRGNNVEHLQIGKILGIPGLFGSGFIAFGQNTLANGYLVDSAANRVQIQSATDILLGGSSNFTSLSGTVGVTGNFDVTSFARCQSVRMDGDA